MSLSWRSAFWRSAVFLCFPAFGLLAQTAADPAHLTVDAVWRSTTGSAPRNLVWSPDGKLLTYVVAPGQASNGVGSAGDILAIEAATGAARVLAKAAQLSALGSAAVDEKDRDHRERYQMSGFFWAPDGKHLLLDKGGMLWLYDIAAGTGALVVDTHAGSGDDPKFSPDARFVSYIREHNLYVHPVSGGTETALTAEGKEKTGGDTLLNGELDWVYLEELNSRTNYGWSPDSRNVAYVQMDESKVQEYPIEDFLPLHVTVDEQRYPLPGEANPGVRVGVVPVEGGETKWLNLPLSAGNDYIPRLGWVDAKTVWVEILTRNHQHLQMWFADVASGMAKMVHSDDDAKYLEDKYDVEFVGHGRFLNTNWSDGHTHVYLYGYDQKNPIGGEAKLLRQLTKGDFEVDSPEVPAGSESVVFNSTEGSPLEQNLWTVKLDGTGKRRLTTGKGVHDASLSPDGRYFADHVSTLETAPVVSVCAAEASGACNAIWKSRPSAPVTGAKTRFVTFKAADGVTTLYGRLTEPSGAMGEGSVPLILNPYGGPTGSPGVRNGFEGQTGLFNDLLAQHGFAVLEVDNRGSGGRGRAFQQVDFRDFGAVQFSDQMACLDQVLVSHPAFDAKRVGWWGWSWGGTFTLYAMTHTDRIKAGVAVAPVTDFRNYDSIYTERYLGLPGANAAIYDAAAVTKSAAKLKGRVLIAQGTGDDNVHMANALQFVQELIRAGIPYDLQMFPRLTHSLNGLAARDELFGRILYQFETYLKPVQ